ncbi:MAG: aldehyde dehydrogenase (NADP(+)), partial [Bacteroidota bacterium]
MELQGTQWIGGSASRERIETFHAYNPATAEPLPTPFHEASASEIDAAVRLAEDAFDEYRQMSRERRASFLEEIGNQIMALGDALLEQCQLESGLPLGRLKGERGRTVNQLKLFAQVVREGSWIAARIDRALPNRKPMPRVDIRQMLIPLGPVAIFGASNFPLAFSVAGGDTASALAAACPVVVKGHPAHPATSEMVGRAILAAAQKTEMPDGVFSLVHGAGHQTGQRLVQHPLIQAVGFTGSFRGGKALFDLANQREVPIPVYAEMGSTNPVFILPEAQTSYEQIAKSLAASITLGVGQFCTNPGLVFLPESEYQADFATALQNAIQETEAGTMLTSGIREAFEAGISRLQETIGSVPGGKKSNTANAAAGQVYQTDLATFLQHPELAEEVFGPSSILVRANEKESLLDAARSLEGHLTATIHGTSNDLYEYQELITILERKVGRLVFNGFPTGVEVCDAMVHGGPYPATTAPQTTSVGTMAIQRFARPVCYQNLPEELLPLALQDPNPLRIWRMVNGPTHSYNCMAP